MKEITLRIDDEIYRKVRRRASQEGKSVSAMVNDFLTKQVGVEDERESRRIAALDELYLIADSRRQTREIPLKPLTRNEIYSDNLGQNLTQE